MLLSGHDKPVVWRERNRPVLPGRFPPENPLPSHYPQKTRQEKTVSAHAGKSPNRRTAQVSGTGHLLSQTTNDFAAGLPNVQDYIGVRKGASGQRAGETGMLIPVFAGSSGAAPYL